MKVDLHLHSTASDGSFSPKQIVQLALLEKNESHCFNRS